LRVLQGLESVQPFDRRPVLTIGNFDGVHRAHQTILKTARETARETSTETVVLTFDPHPLAILAPRKSPLRLMPLEEKLRCLELASADVVVVARSEPKLLGLEAEVFVREVIRDQFRPRSIVEGPSFGFGRGRRGDVTFLREVCESFDCDVRVVEPFTVTRPGSVPVLVSSSLIRRLLLDGDVEGAAACLGRNYALFGQVVEGDRRGRTLGFPTANLQVDEQLVPTDAVYAGWSVVGNEHFATAVSIGSSPTFGGGARRIEAHLLDFTGDLYGQELRLELVARVRDQRSFISASALTEQLNLDIETVRAALRVDTGTRNSDNRS